VRESGKLLRLRVDNNRSRTCLTSKYMQARMSTCFQGEWPSIGFGVVLLIKLLIRDDMKVDTEAIADFSTYNSSVPPYTGLCERE
jgi:hypothetical protein